MSAAIRARATQGEEFGTKRFRSGEPVWRNSYYEGQVEHRVWRKIGNGTKRGASRWLGAVLSSAKAMERRTRRERRKDLPGSRNGAIGDVGLDVLEALYELVDYATGRLEPAIGTLADMTGRSYAAVHEALCRLRAHGFISWIRRSRPTNNEREAGPQVEQITNAYALLVPSWAQTWIARLFKPSPTPEDVSWRRQQDRLDWRAMLKPLPAAEFMAATWNGDRLLGETLLRLGKLLDGRESSSAGETGG